MLLNKGDDLMAQVNVNIRMDENLKKQFDAFCNEIGMNMTTAICVFAKTAVRQNKIPFEISADYDPFYSEVNQARLIKAISELQAGNGKIHELLEVEDE